ncbi:hypothetical protein SAY86_023225 [Trapa natans]|uniref:Secoisolariciresinol dehydrogenase n=1 Tax=Trapa natans TaxID=22666 RepID=A0AAN7MAC7_TRANT|nr:hypothetical protein SAY86_023225 [Trapa natans]
MIDCCLFVRLESKVAIITGGASGIGESTARLFVRNGAKVVVADIQDALGLALCEQLGGPEGVATYVHCDVTQDADVRNAVDEAVNRYGGLDIMFCNAGVWGNKFPSLMDSDDGNFRRVMEVNVFGAYLGAKHAARVMVPAGRGCILFTASVFSATAGSLSHPYLSSKHAVVGLAKNLSVELGQHGIRVNCVSPYIVATPLSTRAAGKGKEELEELASSAATLKGVVLEAQDVAEAALYLVSDESKYVHGVNLVVDGGFSVTNPTFAGVLRSRA